jgi:hypothetical protein
VERSKAFKLAAADKKILEKLVARPSAPAGHARRARVILLSADGVKGKEIAKMVGFPQSTCRESESALSAATLSPSPAGRTRWTTRLLGKKFGLTSWTISKILRANELEPHLVRTYKVSRDPEIRGEGEGRRRALSEAAG